MWMCSKIFYPDVNNAYKFIFQVVKDMHSDTFLPTPSFAICLDLSAASTILRQLIKSILGGSLYLGPFLKTDRNPLSGIQARSPVTNCRRWIQKWRVRTRARRLNRTPNIRIRSDLVVLENDISNRFYCTDNR